VLLIIHRANPYNNSDILVSLHDPNNVLWKPYMFHTMDSPLSPEFVIYVVQGCDRMYSMHNDKPMELIIDGKVA
jgi:hypothetical protein